ncbi:MAG: TIGR03943 family protein [Acidimicrobiales bacterium]|nr:TIGR03943 family protein [Acidimicrobiales bacterium]
MKPLDKPLLVASIAAMTIWVAATSILTRYVRTSMRPWLLSAAGVLVIASAIKVIRTWRHCNDRDANDEGHAHNGRVGWLLLLPVVIAVLADPSALGAASIARGQSPLRQPRTPHLDLQRFLTTHSAGGQVPRLTMTQFLAAASDNNDSAQLAATEVELLGFVVANTPNGFLLARLQIGCCAADAVPIVVDVVAAQPVHYAPDTWLAVQGRYDRTTTEARLQSTKNTTEVPYPVFVASTISPTKAPDPTYEYPY